MKDIMIKIKNNMFLNLLENRNWGVAILLLFSLSIWANEPYFKEQKHTEIQKISKEFQVSSSPSLYVSNRYGDITLLTDKNLKDKIKIEVEIKVSANDPSVAQSRIKEISVNFSQNASDVWAKTQIAESNSFFGLRGRKSSVQMKINYKVSLPVKTHLTLENKYGNIFLNRIEHDVKIDAQYGNLQLGEVLANAKLDLEYISKANMESIKYIDMDASYSNIFVEKADKVDLEASYTNLKLGSIKQLQADVSYGNFDINEADFLSLESDYTNVSIGKISNQLSVDSDYGRVIVKEVLPTTKSVSMKSSYASISVNYHRNWSFNYYFSTSYASLRTPDNLPFTERDHRQTSKYVKGSKGKANNLFRIESDYGGVSITEE
ncbi:hypothetical protein CGC49_06765 [Capnocytophaga sp. H4358]|nr:hypothetical protein CGC49_06765 [Capnocytophaga sp. H4358]